MAEIFVGDLMGEDATRLLVLAWRQTGGDELAIAGAGGVDCGFIDDG
jgi:hypothetical protein